MDELEVERLLRALAKVKVRMATVKDRNSTLSAERVALYRSARAAGATLKAIAEVSGVSDVAVLRALQADDAKSQDG